MQELEELARRYEWSEQCLEEVRRLVASAPSERYRDVAPLSRGATAEVHRVHDRALDRSLVRKRLLQGLQHTDLEDRFQAEVRVSAGLQHPGVVAVHDLGRDDEGRPWFVMAEIGGQTLEQVIAQLHAGDRALREVIGLLLQASEVVAYAHSQGVLHRDLKPANVMVGDFGQVYVIDWGLSRGQPSHQAPILRDATRHGVVMGTPAFMAPEQARGELERLGPATDVFGLGAILFAILTGRPPHPGPPQAAWARAVQLAEPPVPGPDPDQGPLPEALVEAMRRALQPDPGDRPADAAAFAALLRRWLFGQAQLERAQQAMDEARALAPAIERAQARAAELRAQAREQAAGIQPWDPDEAKRSAWTLEDRADEREREAEVLRARWLAAVSTAIQLAPDLDAGHAALAQHHLGAWARARREGRRRDAVLHQLLLERHDRGTLRAAIDGDSTISLSTDPPGIGVVAEALGERDRRLVVVARRLLGPTPLRRVPLPAGRWQLRLVAAGGEAVVPVHSRPGEAWRGGLDGPGAHVIWPDPWPPSACYVPAGWCRVGGDPLAVDGLAATDVWIEGFLIDRHPVTHREFHRFLVARHAQGADVEAWLPRPAARGPDGQPPAPLYRPPDALPEGLDPDEPVVLITLGAAEAYAAWRSAETGLAWRLPHELEWEKAARGVDGRIYPWGNHMESAWACVLNHSATGARRATVHAFPLDVSPYGVRGLGGNVRDLCGNAFSRSGPRIVDGRYDPALLSATDPGLRTVKGGSWTSVDAFARSAARFVCRPGQRFVGAGFRLLTPVGRGGRGAAERR